MKLDFRKTLQFEEFERTDITLISIVVAAAVFGVGYVLDLFVVWRFASTSVAVFFSNLLTGIFFGVIAYRVMLRMIKRQRISEQQLGTLAEMSRQLRNAQLIVQQCVHEPFTREMAEREMGSVYSGMQELLSNLEEQVTSPER